MSRDAGLAEATAGRLYRWVRYGPRPPDEAGMVDVTIGMLVWWRIWAMMVVVGVGYLVVLHQFSPDALWPFGLGLVTATIAHEVMNGGE